MKDVHHLNPAILGFEAMLGNFPYQLRELRREGFAVIFNPDEALLGMVDGRVEIDPNPLQRENIELPLTLKNFFHLLPVTLNNLETIRRRLQALRAGLVRHRPVPVFRSAFSPHERCRESWDGPAKSLSGR